MVHKVGLLQAPRPILSSISTLINQLHVLPSFQGCSEGHNPFIRDYPPWTAFRTVDYGYSRMTVHNKTHIYLDQVSTTKVRMQSLWLQVLSTSQNTCRLQNNPNSSQQSV